MITFFNFLICNLDLATPLILFTFEVFRHCSCRHFVWVPIKDKCETLIYSSVLSIFIKTPCQSQAGGSSEVAPVKGFSKQRSKKQFTWLTVVGAEDFWRSARICLVKEIEWCRWRSIFPIFAFVFELNMKKTQAKELTCTSHPWGHFSSWNCNTCLCQLVLPDGRIIIIFSSHVCIYHFISFETIMPVSVGVAWKDRYNEPWSLEIKGCPKESLQ